MGSFHPGRRCACPDSMKERSSWCYTRCSAFFHSPKAQTGGPTMLYLAIDQHRKQLTVNLRNEAGDVILKRQVSTEWARVREFMEEVRESERAGGRVCRDRGSLRVQRLVLEAAGGIRLQGCRAHSAGKADQEQDRPPRRQCLGRTAVDQSPASAGGQEGAERAADRAAFATRCGGPPVDRAATADGPAENAGDQPGAAPAVEAQLAAGVSDQGPANPGGQDVAGEAAAGRD